MTNTNANDRPANSNNVPLFASGRIFATPEVLAACTRAHLDACLARYLCGDWGLVGAEDQAENQFSLREGFRILSAHPLDPARPDGARLWIITEADRSITTFLLPGEY
jgi:hypothetical protein